MLTFFARPWTLPSRITSRDCSISRRTEMVTGSGLLVTWLLVVLLVPLPCALSTLWIMPVLVLQMMPRLPRREEETGNLMVLLMFTARPWQQMVLLGCTVDLTSHVWVSLSTVVCTLGCTIQWSLLFWPEIWRLVTDLSICFCFYVLLVGFLLVWPGLVLLTISIILVPLAAGCYCFEFHISSMIRVVGGECTGHFLSGLLPFSWSHYE